MKSIIYKHRGKDCIIRIAAMKIALQEEWNYITLEEINQEISKLPIIMEYCIKANGDNNYHG
jgi:hypothetical protein